MVSVEYTASKVLRALLEDLARDQLDIDDGPGLRARTIHVGHGQGSSVLVPVWAGEGYPADVGTARVDVISGYVGTTELFEQHGFERASETTAHSGGRERWIMRKEL